MLNLTILETVLALHAGNIGVAPAAILTNCPSDFLTFCQRHQIAAYVWSRLEETDLVERLEPRVRKGFQLAHLDQWQRSERLLRDLQSLSARFDESGLEFIAMKGPYLAQRFFGGIERRAFSDLDILVRTDSLAASIELLRAEGYTAVSPVGLPGWTRRFLHHVELKKGATTLDLHHTLRAHPTFQISEESLWAREVYFNFPAFSCRVLPEDLSLLVQILSIHTDVGLGIANLKMMIDIDRVLHACHKSIDWSAFLLDRERDGTLAITLNVFALLLTTFRNAERYPDITRLLKEHREVLVWQPDRNRYLQLLDDTTLRLAKGWALRQYHQSFLSAVTTWAMSLPVMALGLGESFLSNLRERRISQPRISGKRHRSSAGLWDSPQGLVEGLGGDPNAIQRCRIKLGSLSLQLSYTDEKYLTMLGELFRLQAFPLEIENAAWEGEDHLLLFDVTEDRLRDVIPRPSQPLIDRSLEEIIEIHRDAACCLVRRSGAGLKIAIPVISASEEYAHLLHCVMVVFYRALFALETLPLHSAAIQFGDSANLFIGDKGAGKSTISLSLGLAGGRVLGEDHVLIRRAEGRFLVSGCDGKSRLTAKSEDHFFAKPLPVAPQEVAGVWKKEIELADHVRSAPFKDVLVGRIFFPHVGKELSIRKMKGAEALVKMLGMMRERQRFVGAEDRKSFLDFFGDLLGSTEIWDLTLSPDLTELDELAEFVNGRSGNRLDETA